MNIQEFVYCLLIVGGLIFLYSYFCNQISNYKTGNYNIPSGCKILKQGKVLHKTGGKLIIPLERYGDVISGVETDTEIKSAELYANGKYITDLEIAAGEYVILDNLPMIATEFDQITINIIPYSKVPSSATIFYQNTSCHSDSFKKWTYKGKIFRIQNGSISQ